MLLLTEDEARAAIRAKVQSKDWWIVPWFGDHAGAFCERVEERFYTGRHAAGCEVHLGPVPVTFFAKRRLPRGRLAKEMVAFGVQSSERRLVEVLRTQDVLLFDVDHANPQRVMAWHDWVMS